MKLIADILALLASGIFIFSALMGNISRRAGKIYITMLFIIIIIFIILIGFVL